MISSPIYPKQPGFLHCSVGWGRRCRLRKHPLDIGLNTPKWGYMTHIFHTHPKANVTNTGALQEEHALNEPNVANHD